MWTTIITGTKTYYRWCWLSQKSKSFLRLSWYSCFQACLLFGLLEFLFIQKDKFSTIPTIITRLCDFDNSHDYLFWSENTISFLNLLDGVMRYPTTKDGWVSGLTDLPNKLGKNIPRIHSRCYHTDNGGFGES